MTMLRVVQKSAAVVTVGFVLVAVLPPTSGQDQDPNPGGVAELNHMCHVKKTYYETSLEEMRRQFAGAEEALLSIGEFTVLDDGSVCFKPEGEEEYWLVPPNPESNNPVQVLVHPNIGEYTVRFAYKKEGTQRIIAEEVSTDTLFDLPPTETIGLVFLEGSISDKEKDSDPLDISSIDFDPGAKFNVFNVVFGNSNAEKTATSSVSASTATAADGAGGNCASANAVNFDESYENFVARHDSLMFRIADIFVDDDKEICIRRAGQDRFELVTLIEAADGPTTLKFSGKIAGFPKEVLGLQWRYLKRNDESTMPNDRSMYLRPGFGTLVMEMSNFNVEDADAQVVDVEFDMSTPEPGTFGITAELPNTSVSPLRFVNLYENGGVGYDTNYLSSNGHQLDDRFLGSQWYAMPPGTYTLEGGPYDKDPAEVVVRPGEASTVTICGANIRFCEGAPQTKVGTLKGDGQLISLVGDAAFKKGGLKQEN